MMVGRPCSLHFPLEMVLFQEDICFFFGGVHVSWTLVAALRWWDGFNKELHRKYHLPVDCFFLFPCFIPRTLGKLIPIESYNCLFFVFFVAGFIRRYIQYIYIYSQYMLFAKCVLLFCIPDTPVFFLFGLVHVLWVGNFEMGIFQDEGQHLYLNHWPKGMDPGNSPLWGKPGMCSSPGGVP